MGVEKETRRLYSCCRRITQIGSTSKLLRLQLLCFLWFTGISVTTRRKTAGRLSFAVVEVEKGDEDEEHDVAKRPSLGVKNHTNDDNTSLKLELDTLEQRPSQDDGDSIRNELHNLTRASENLKKLPSAANSTTTATKRKKYRGWAMMHTVKAGGTSLKNILNLVGWSGWNEKPNDRSLYIYHRLYEWTGGIGFMYFDDDNGHEGEGKAQYIQSRSNQSSKQWFSALPRDEFFKIGHVREPCDYHVSVWAYSGKDRQHGLLTSKCAGSDAVGNFSKFLEATHPKFGWLTYRVAQQLGAARDGQRDNMFVCYDELTPETTSSVPVLMEQFDISNRDWADCWVRTENLLADLKRCLNMYVKERGGETSMLIDKLNEFKDNTQANRGKHSSCESYYSQAEKELLWAREGNFAEQFGYRGCCKGLGENPQPVLPHL